MMMDDMCFAIAETAIDVMLDKMREQANFADAQIGGCLGMIEMSMEHNAILVEKRAIPCLLKAMQMHLKNVTVQENACEALNCILRNHSLSMLEQSVRQNASEILAEVMLEHPHVPQIQRKGLIALSVLLKNCDNNVPKKNHHILEALVKVMSLFEDDVDMQISGCSALEELETSFNSIDLDDVNLKLEASALLINSITQHGSNVDLLERGLAVLSKISCTLKPPPQLVKLGIVKRVVREMITDKDHPNIHISGCQLMAIIAIGEENRDRKLLKHGAIECIVQSMNKFPHNGRLQQCGCNAFMMLAKHKRGDMTSAEMRTAAAAVFSVMDMHSGNAKVIRFAFKTLTSLIEGNSEKLKILVEKTSKELLPLLYQEISSTSSDLIAFREACDLCWTLAASKDTEFKMKIIDAKIGEEILKGMHMHPTDQGIRIRACAVLWNLVNSEKALECCPRKDPDIFWDKDQDDTGIQDEKYKIIFDTLRASDVPGCILEPMFAHRDEAPVQHRGCKLLLSAVCILCSDENSRPFELGIAENLTDIIERFPSHSGIQTYANRAFIFLEKRILKEPLKVLMTSLWLTNADTDLETGFCRRFADMLNTGFNLGEPIKPIMELMLKKIQREPICRKLQYQACRVLVALCGEEFEELLFEVGTDKVIMDLMLLHPKNADIQTVSCDLLSILCSVEAAKAAMMERKAEQLILKVARQHLGNKRALSSALCALTSFCDFEDAVTVQAVEEVVENEGFELILEAMRRHRQNAHIQDDACDLLAILLLTDDNMVDKLWSLGGATEILLALQEHESMTILQANACRMISRFASNSKYKASLLDRGADRSVINAIRKHPLDETVQQYGIGAIEALAKGTLDTVKIKLLQLGAADFIFLSILRHKSSAVIQSSCCDAIRALAPLSVPSKITDEKVVRFWNKAPDLLLEVARNSLENRDVVLSAKTGLLKLHDCKMENRRLLHAGIEACLIFLQIEKLPDTIHSHCNEILQTLLCLEKYLVLLGPSDPLELFEKIREGVIQVEEKYSSISEIAMLTGGLTKAINSKRGEIVQVKQI